MNENDYISLVDSIRLFLSERNYQVGVEYDIVSSLNSNGINELRSKLFKKGTSLFSSLSNKVTNVSNAVDLIDERIILTPGFARANCNSSGLFESCEFLESRTSVLKDS